MPQKPLPYPQLLDNFRNELLSAIPKIRADSLRPAILADVAKAYDAILCNQQLLTMSYNLQVFNFERMVERMIELEKKIDGMETKLAGYSERLNAVEAKITPKI